MAEPRIELGKIARAAWGLGGYQDAQIGLTITMVGFGFGVTDFFGAWSTKRNEFTQWTEEDRLRELGEAAMKCAELLKQAKKSDVSELVNVPVQVTISGNKMISWRILEEVL